MNNTPCVWMLEPATARTPQIIGKSFPMKRLVPLAVLLSFLLASAVFLSNEHHNKEQLVLKYPTPLVEANHHNYIKAREKQGIKGAAAWLEKRLMDPGTGKINYSEIKRVREVVANRNVSGSARSSSLNLRWEEQGPDNVGGRTRAILIDRNNPERMYAGSVTGGLFVSDNGGLSWNLHPSFSELPYSQSISSLAQAPNGDIYAGTGESYVYTEANTVGHIGDGIYKSSDNGQTFRQLPSTKTSSWNADETWSYVNEIAADPGDYRKIYAATNGGLMISSDSGSTWLPAQGIPESAARDVAVGANGVVHAAVGFGNERYYRSEDGASFELVALQNGFPITNTRRIELAISPDDPDYVYALIVRSDDKLRGIYRSTDAGMTWEVYSPENSDVFNPLGDQGNYDACIAVVPSNKDKVWIGGQVQLQAGGNDVGWRLIASASSRGAANPYYVHADMHEIVFHPSDPNIAFVGTDGGVFKSENALNDFPTFTERNKGYITTQFYNMAASAAGELLAGAQDNGTSHIDFKGNTRLTADLVRGGDGGYCAISKVNPDAFFAEIQFGEIFRSSSRGSAWSCWWDKFAKGSSTDCTPDGGCEFIAPFILWEDVGSEKAFFVFGGASRIYLTPEPLNFSADPVFYRVNLPGSDYVSTIEKTTDGIFYVGLGNGYVYRLDSVITANYSAGNVVTGIKVKEIASHNTWGWAGYVAGIAADPNNPAHVVVTLANYTDEDDKPHVFVSTNATSAAPTFTSIQGDLPHFPVYSAVIDYYNPDNIIIGTDMGMWATSDEGQTWLPEFDGMNPVPVFTVFQEMLYDNDCRVIYAGTYGRGMFRTVTLLEANRGQACSKSTAVMDLTGAVASLQLYPNPVVSLVMLDIELSRISKLTFSVVDLLGRKAHEKMLGTAGEGSHRYEIDFSAVQPGVYLAIVDAGGSRIMKRIVVLK